VSGAVLAPGVHNPVTIRLGRGAGGVGSGRFGPPRDFPAGLRPYHVVAADFDHDGILDLAVANYGNARVSILRGLGVAGVGDGTFAAPVQYATGSTPFHLATGDLDQDGSADLVVVNNNAGSVSVLRNAGDGTFEPQVAFSVLGSFPAAVEIGDFNHDGISDVAVALYGGEVSVLRGSGTDGVWSGSFLPAQKYFVGAGTFGLAQADLTGDELPELVTGNNGGNVSVLVGQEIPGDDAAMFGGLRTYPAGTNPGAVVLADVDEDGRLDVVTTNASVDSITVLRRSGGTGIGAGSFGAPTRYAVVDFPLALVTGDLNEDGRADLAVTGWNSHDVQVLLGACAVAPQPTPEPGLAPPQDVPNDEGGAVHLSWLASDFDQNVAQTVTSYRVWRRLPPGMFPAVEARPGGDESVVRADVIARLDGTAITYWEAIASLPATGLAGYALDAPTARDSLPGDCPYTAFFVTAVTANPDVFYASKAESAYSVDNLAPPAPAPFTAVYGPDRATLQWGPSPAPDRASYRLYRGAWPGFTPAPENRIATLVDTTYVDLDPMSITSSYRLTVVDVHGNEGPSSLVHPDLVGVPAEPRVLALSLANPSSGGLVVAFSLATESPARLEAFDAKGRRVFASIETGAGEQRKLLGAGWRLAAGVYVVRLTQDGATRTAKAVLLP
jgi:hypothetical protein